MSGVTCQVSCVRCIVKHVRDHMSCVMCHVSCVICHVSCLMCQVSCARCHVSGFMCQVSRVRYQLSLFFFLFFLLFFRIKCLDYSVEGLLSTGPIPSTLRNLTIFLCQACTKWLFYTKQKDAGTTASRSKTAKSRRTFLPDSFKYICILIYLH